MNPIIVIINIRVILLAIIIMIKILIINNDNNDKRIINKKIENQTNTKNSFLFGIGRGRLCRWNILIILILM